MNSSTDTDGDLTTDVHIPQADVAKMLSTLAQMLLASFQTTLQQDREMLRSSTASWEERLAITFRYTESAGPVV
jgi:hypothetical protein